MPLLLRANPYPSEKVRGLHASGTLPSGWSRGYDFFLRVQHFVFAGRCGKSRGLSELERVFAWTTQRCWVEAEQEAEEEEVGEEAEAEPKAEKEEAVKDEEADLPFDIPKPDSSPSSAFKTNFGCENDSVQATQAPPNQILCCRKRFTQVLMHCR